MKFSTFFALAAGVGSALAQHAFIAAPAPGTNITPGSNITITASRGSTTSSVVEVAIVLSLGNCLYSPPGTCDDFDYTGALGTTLYLGPWNPDTYLPIVGPGADYQNFTVTVPSSLQKGAAVLTISHWDLVGAGPENLFETSNVTLNVV